MRCRWLAVVATPLVGCMSVNGVVVTPDQLQTLAGLKANEERGFRAVDHGETLYARGTDEVRLVVWTGEPPRKAEQPWVHLYELHWDAAGAVTPPSGTPLVENGNLLLVPATDLKGADVEISRYDGGKTAALVLGILAGVAATAALSVLIITLEINNHPS